MINVVMPIKIACPVWLSIYRAISASIKAPQRNVVEWSVATAVQSKY
jgi:hypothetical protein